MRHLDEGTLVLLHYEDGARDEDREHLQSCTRCQGELRAIARDLVAAAELEPTVPARDELYGARVWQSLEPKFGSPPAPAGRVRRYGPTGIERRYGLLLATAAVLLVAFLAGRVSTRWTDTPNAPDGETLRERVLLVAIGDHLDRSRMLLLEVKNSSSGDFERQTANELLTGSRLYRQSGRGVLDGVTTEALDELERLLLDVAHRTSSTEAIRARIDREDILFKIRLLQASLLDREEGRALQQF